MPAVPETHRTSNQTRKAVAYGVAKEEPLLNTFTRDALLRKCAKI